MTFLKSAGMCLASEIFKDLGNSATAATRRWVATSSTIDLDTHKTPALKKLLDLGIALKLLESRHPDPQATLTLRVTVPALQVQGSWTRLQHNWNGRLYVSGGRKSEQGPYYRDIWTLDLAKLDAWRKLPDYPVPLTTTGNFLGFNMVLYKDTALLFTGRPTIDVFDLKSETWRSFLTIYSPTPADKAAGVVSGWPWPGAVSFDSAMQVIGDKMYVFGGGHGSTWRRLSGTVRVTQNGDYSCPGPRKTAASWVSGSGETTRFYLLFGVFDRDEAWRHNEIHGADIVFGCSDFWSWSMACAFNEKLQKAIVFGGYCPNLSTCLRRADGREEEFPYSYVADTFVYDTLRSATATADFLEPTRSAPRWKQVLTPGFPTYRCQAHMQCDPATGRTYMFGGWTNTLYIPTQSKLMARTFGDLWELRVNVEGGHFEEVDVEEEARVARAGPWQRCFSCGAAGPWKKCGGSCKGRVFFCGIDCLRDGWKLHKTTHDCRKA
ncbi:hypothetical protein R3P38DRAFT_3302407 [Favolaschia claudopus]|uniref:MYND-type domain-containing protein n=1 Tax=Favolaschia claudopus TaxID=2862362 RepID=A0AAW0ELV8_9AGAR